MIGKRVHAVLELKDPTANVNLVMARLAQYANDNFGKGGNIASHQIEGFVGFVNTPIYGGYFTTEINIDFGQALEIIGETADARLVRVEWKTDEAGEPIVYEPITYEVEHVDKNGVITILNNPIGRISN